MPAKKVGSKKAKKNQEEVVNDEVGKENVAAEPAVVEPSPVHKDEPKTIEEPPDVPMTEAPGEKVVEAKPQEEEKPKEEEEKKPQDVEKDAVSDKRKRITNTVAFNAYDSTINVLVSEEESILSTFHQAGLSSLVAGVKGNVGVRAGRYYYEVKVVDVHPNAARRELKVGFSTSSADLLGADEGCFVFDLPNRSFQHGATDRLNCSTKRAGIPDVVGLLLNRDAKSQQVNTISLFINSERVSEPQQLPENTNVLFPHVIYKGCAVAVNFKTIISPLSFSVRMLGDASVEDVEETPIKEPDVAEAVFPIGFDNEDYAKDFASAYPNFVVLTTRSMRQWAERSGQKRVECCEDGGAHIGSLMRKRKYIVAMADSILASERKRLCSSFRGYKKRAHVMLGATTRHVDDYEKVTLPTEDEGFDEIEYIKPKSECEQALEAWKADCKLRSRIVDLKPSTFFKETMLQFKMLVDAKKKDKEFGEWSEEDYMLLNLRAEIHYLLYAVVMDAEDDARKGFSTAHFMHYYRLYTGRAFSLPVFGLSVVDDLLELISDVVQIDEKTLMLPKLPKNIAQTDFFEMVENERRARQDHLDAGDENAKLKFSADRSHMKGQKGAGKGGKGHQAGFPEYTMRTIPNGLKRLGAPMWEQGPQKKR